jgi:hypothetical protein
VPTPFRIVALPAETFRPLFAMDDRSLRERGARRMVADAKPGFPCRVSLVDAEPGERVLLLPFTHLDADSPYRASGPIFVREAAATATPPVNEVPAMLRSRLLSVRAYDRAAMMVAAEVVEGRDLEAAVDRLFADPDVGELHVHNAKPGCFDCRIERA